MNILERSVATTRVAPPVHWHFRAMPPEVQRGAIRRLALSGVAEEDIAARTGWSVESVRRAILDDECVRRLALPVGSPSRPLRVKRNGSLTI